MLSRRFFGHTLPGRPESEWELLEDHLRDVAELAAEFAGVFAADDYGRLAGQWHDLGKYSDAFQDNLRTPEGPEGHLEQSVDRVDHSTAGAQHANATVPRVGRMLAYAIAGHHSGLADAADLDKRLDKNIEEWKTNAEGLLSLAPSLGLPPVTIDRDDPKRYAFQCALFTRMLFS